MQNKLEKVGVHRLGNQKIKPQQPEIISKQVVFSKKPSYHDPPNVVSLAPLKPTSNFQKLTLEIDSMNGQEGKETMENKFNSMKQPTKQFPSKKVIIRDTLNPKLENNKHFQPGSPKFNPPNQKVQVLHSYNSEKHLQFVNFNQPVKNPEIIETKELIAKELTNSKSYIEEIQKEVEQQRIIIFQFQEKEKIFIHENQMLRNQVAAITLKFQKMKELNDESKKLLKNRISNFNEEGDQLKDLKHQVKELEGKLGQLVGENEELKNNMSKMTENIDLHNRVSQKQQQNDEAEEEELELRVQSTINCDFWNPQTDGDLLEFNEDTLNKIQSHIEIGKHIDLSEKSCIQTCKDNLEIFQQIKVEYGAILGDMEERYKAVHQEMALKMKEQAGEMDKLQLQIDELHDTNQKLSTVQPSSDIYHPLSFDQILLKKMIQIGNLQQQIHTLRQQNRELKENTEHYRMNAKFLEAQVDVERMKRIFCHQNQKFQFNVIKLNMLTVIEKLKLQIENEKHKLTKLKKIKEKKEKIDNLVHIQI